jgi:hypothetical protein
VTYTCPPITILASVFVRYIAGVEGRNQRSISKGTQEAEECFKGGVARMGRSTPFLGSQCIAHWKWTPTQTHVSWGRIALFSTTQVESASPYTEVYESVKAVPIVSGATAWIDDRTGSTYILVINEGLWMPAQ